MLHKDHPLLRPKEENARVIILTSYATFYIRHGPTALQAWRKLQRRQEGLARFSTKELAMIFETPDR